MKVRDGEGVANRIGPEPCASNGEASVGECTGQPLNRERPYPGRRRRSAGGRSLAFPLAPDLCSTAPQHRRPDKTRLIEFGRHAAERRARAGLGKPETFKFLGDAPADPRAGTMAGTSRQGLLRVPRRADQLVERAAA